MKPGRTQRLHDERPEDRARDRPDAAGERGAADDGGGDDVQLVAWPTSSVEPFSRADEIAAAMRAQEAHQDERLHDRPAGVDAGQLGGVGVAAVGVHVAAEPAPRRE